MRFLHIALTCAASLVNAQIAAGPPECGFNVIIESVGNSGCGLSDPACLCTAQKTIDRIKKELPKKCSQPSDLDVYSGVFNQMCASYPGFPINLAQIAEENSGSKVRAAAWAVPLAVAGAMLI